MSPHSPEPREVVTFDALLTDPNPHIGEVRILVGRYIPVTPLVPDELSRATVTVQAPALPTAPIARRSRTLLEITLEGSPTEPFVAGQMIRLPCLVTHDAPSYVSVVCGLDG